MPFAIWSRVSCPVLTLGSATCQASASDSKHDISRGLRKHWHVSTYFLASLPLPRELTWTRPLKTRDVEQSCAVQLSQTRVPDQSRDSHPRHEGEPIQDQQSDLADPASRRYHLPSAKHHLESWCLNSPFLDKNSSDPHKGFWEVVRTRIICPILQMMIMIMLRLRKPSS